MPVSVAYPFITVTTDDSGLRPVVTRAPGVLAVVGTTASGANGGTAKENEPVAVASLADAVRLFAATDNQNAVKPTPLYSALEIAFLQSPGPSKVYGVRTGSGGVAPALAALEAVADVTVVALADAPGAPPNGPAPESGVSADAGLKALQTHVDNVSQAGNARIGVGMVNPLTERSDTYVQAVKAATTDLVSSRMVVVAARGATDNAGVAAAAAIAGYPPSVSVVLKPVRGLAIPLASQYSPGEIHDLSEIGVIPIIDPVLISGESLHLAEGRNLAVGDPREFIDTVRTLDDIDFRLKAGLVGMIGDARITRSGMSLVKARIEAILGVVQREGAIDGFGITIPVLDILSMPESARSGPDVDLLATARSTRSVAIRITVVMAPATHRIDISLVVSNTGQD